MLKIETYEPYHIGIKLTNALALPAFRKRVISALSEQTDFVVSVVAFDGLSPNDVIATINDVRIEINYQSQALNVIGDEPETTTTVFKKLLDILESLDYELDNTLVVFYEILSNVLVNVDEDYSKVLTNSVSCDLNGFKELNSNVKISTVKIDFVDKESGNEALDLVIGSNQVRPKTSMIVGIKYRTSDKVKTLDFCDKIEERVLTLLKSFGSKT